jgi:hypothetical protein
MARFEEAIFRVYDGSLEGIREADEHSDASSSAKACRYFQHAFLGLSVFLMLTLVTLHTSIVGQSGCLQGILQERMHKEHLTTLLPDDAILQINIDPNFRDDIIGQDNDDLFAGPGSRRQLHENQEVSHGGRDDQAEGTIWHAWTYMTTSFSKPIAPREQQRHNRGMFGGGDSTGDGNRGCLDEPYLGVAGYVASSAAGFVQRILHSSKSSSSNSSRNNNNSKSSNTSHDHPKIDPRYTRQFDFEFAFDISVLTLSDERREQHKFELINVTMDGSSCFGGNLLSRALLPFGGGVDNAIVNDLMYTLDRGGMLTTKNGDYYIWRGADLHPYSTAGEWLGFKLFQLVKVCFLFFLLSHSTALLVRVLVSCGVVLLLPVFWLRQVAGVAVAVQQARIISHAYPWIGVPMELYTAQGRSYMPFLIGHVGRLILYYVLFEAVQFACSMWFYDSPQPGQKELWLFACMMVWEYFSLIYARSSTSIQLFPRACLTAFAVYHFYLYSYPSGFHILALCALFSATMSLMLLLVRKYETVAYNRGIVSPEQVCMSFAQLG